MYFFQGLLQSRDSYSSRYRGFPKIGVSFLGGIPFKRFYFNWGTPILGRAHIDGGGSYSTGAWLTHRCLYSLSPRSMPVFREGRHGRLGLNGPVLKVQQRFGRTISWDGCTNRFRCAAVVVVGVLRVSGLCSHGL